MPLVYSTDYENLPTEPTLRWLKLRDLVERRLENVTDTMNGVSDYDLIEYCTVLVNAAETLNLGSFDQRASTNVREDYDRIRAQIIALATKLSINSASVNTSNSVALSTHSKRKIRHQIERLRSLIEASDFDARRKEKLKNKLDDLYQLTIAERIEFGNFFSLLAAVSVAVAGVTSFLADAPDAIATITSIIGEEKEIEIEELRLIEAQGKPKAIPDLRNLPVDNVDDEIPF